MFAFQRNETNVSRLLNQICIFRTSKESMLDGVMQSNNDAQRLLRAFKEFMQITSDEQELMEAADGTRYGFYCLLVLLYYFNPDHNTL